MTARADDPAGSRIARSDIGADAPALTAARIGALIVAAAVIPALLFGIAYHFTVDMPFWDEWLETSQILAINHGHILWGEAWAQHNEHRIIVPTTIYLIINAFGSWSPVRETLFGVAILTLILPIFWRMTVETIPRTVVPFVFLALSLLAFSLVQAENLIWGGAAFGWIVPNLLALLGLFLLTRRRLTVRGTVGAFCACVAAAFSQAPGLDSLLVGIVVLVVRPAFDGRRLAAWIAGTVATFAIFLHGYNSNISGPNFKVSAASFWTVYPQYVTAYLGSPLGGWRGLRLSESLGALGIAIFLAALAYYLRRRSRGEAGSELLPWLAICAFVVLNSLLTGYGRAGLGIGQALSSRYTTITTDLWIGVTGLSVLLWPVVARRVRADRAVGRAVVTGAVAIFAFLFANAQIAGFHGVLDLTSRIATGAAAVRHMPDVSDDQLELLYPDPNVLRADVRELERAGITF